MVGIGSIISLGGGAGSGGGGSTSGIQLINGENGPTILFVGVNGIGVSAAGDVITLDVAGLSGIIPATSGIESVNGDSGPHITLLGVNGLTVTPLGGGDILLDAAGASGVGGGGGTVNKFAADFSGTSGQVNHNLGTQDVVVSVRAPNLFGVGPPQELTPDQIIYDNGNTLSVLFNTPTTFRVVVVG